MQCIYIMVRSEEHFPHSLEIEGNHKQGSTFFYTEAYVCMYRDADITAEIGISASCIPLIWVAYSSYKEYPKMPHTL